MREQGWGGRIGTVTSPSAAIQLDSHADGPRVLAVRHDADPPSDDRRNYIPQLRDVRVAVARENLEEEAYPTNYMKQKHARIIFCIKL